MSDIRKQWLQRLEEALVKSQQLPSIEEGFPFPWQEAAEALASAFDMQDLQLSPQAVGWKSGEELLDGMGHAPFIVSLQLAPIGGVVSWMMSSEDVSALTATALSAGPKIDGFSDPRLREGFYQFLLLKSLAALENIKAFKDLSLRLLPQGDPPQEGGVATDIAIGLPGKTIYGRLICPQNLLQEFKKARPILKESPLKQEEIQNLEVVLRSQIGNATLSAEEWRSIMPGDFVILTDAAYDEEENKGSMVLSLGITPLLLCRYKSGSVKVADYAFYSVEPSVAEIEEPSIEADVFEIEDTPLEGEVSEETGHLWSSEESPVLNAPALPPLHIVAEMNKIRMTVAQLVALQPDADLELSFDPEQSVDLTIQGKSVARGDLLKLGDAVGVRVLSIHG